MKSTEGVNGQSGDKFMKAREKGWKGRLRDFPPGGWEWEKKNAREGGSFWRRYYDVRVEKQERGEIEERGLH